MTNNSNQIKIIGPNTSYQTVLNIDGNIRTFTIFGDVHNSLESCYEPEYNEVSMIVDIINKFNNNIPSTYDPQQGVTDLRKMINNINFNGDYIHIYNYLLYLARGDTCIDVFIEENMYDLSYLSRDYPLECNLTFVNRLFALCRKERTGSTSEDKMSRIISCITISSKRYASRESLS